MRKNNLLLSIGSNCNREKNMRLAMNELRHLLNDEVTFSSVLETEAVGIMSPSFLNCLALATTPCPLAELKSNLKHIETQCGNTVEKRLQNCVEMDIDVLLYHGELHHKKDWRRPYVMKLLEELPLGSDELESVAHEMKNMS